MAELNAKRMATLEEFRLQGTLRRHRIKIVGVDTKHRTVTITQAAFNRLVRLLPANGGA